MGERVYWNNDWKFTEKFDEKLVSGDKAVKGMSDIRIPHTVKELALHYCDEHAYQMVSGYRKVFTPEESWKDKTVLLTFDGVAHECEVYLNKEKIGEHHCGYTAFTLDISNKLHFGEKNILTVKVDSRESINVPPFGFVIDYMTYGGIYRDVYVDIKEKTYIEDAFVTTKISKDKVQTKTFTEIKVTNPDEGMIIKQWLKKSGDDEYRLLEKAEQISADKDSYLLEQNTGLVDLWDIDNPNLYYIKTVLVGADEKVIDEKEVRFGYRRAVFKKDGFYLNGKKVKIRGLNRHQSFAYTGYAMPESMQRRDADIMKNELGLNAVRTSHYPQSHYFIDRCDELGLLVFTEIPGWQHIGDEAWKEQAKQNVRDMVTQYRNHTSIILWGVRINESVDDDELYKATNEIARSLDKSRQTGGVRCFKKGSLLEDVYTYNDFSHTGDNAGCEKKSAITPDTNKPYFISEYNGHMFPVKSYDWEEKRCEHALRHARVINDVAGEEEIAGSFGWCMFDYNTHKDFGSGDRICYHGVMDMFRNPKMAAYVYACQQEKTPILEISSTMDIGEHPGSNRGDVYIFTNADSVKMYKNNHFIKEYSAKDSEYSNLAHGPIRINDYIGDLLEEKEGMNHAKAEAVKELLNEVARTGLYNLSKIMYVKAAAVSARYRLKMNEAVELYNKYIGDWGGSMASYTFEAIVGGEVVKTLFVRAMTRLELLADIDHSTLKEVNSYDVAAIRIKAVDENKNLLPFYNDPVKLSVEGPIELIGSNIIALSGGMGGTYIKTTGKSGSGSITIESMNGEKTVIEVNVE